MRELKFLLILIIRNWIHILKANIPTNLTPVQKKILKAMRRDGCYVQPSFLSHELCERLQLEITTLLADPKTKIWKDAEGSDKRIYGADLISPLIHSYYTDDFINTIIDTHEKSTSKSGFALAAKMDYIAKNKGSGGGWHKDRSDKWQSKSLVYLTNVSIKNGPFQYIKGSHRPVQLILDWIRYGIKPSQTRFNDDQIQTLIAKEPGRLITCTGDAGTVLFANTMGIHQGKPIEESFRIAITNYFWSDSGVPAHMQELLQTKKVKLHRR